MLKINPLDKEAMKAHHQGSLTVKLRALYGSDSRVVLTTDFASFYVGSFEDGDEDGGSHICDRHCLGTVSREHADAFMGGLEADHKFRPPVA